LIDADLSEIQQSDNGVGDEVDVNSARRARSHELQGSARHIAFKPAADGEAQLIASLTVAKSRK